MAFVRPKARILERTTTAGNGPYALLGAIDGSYNAFSAFMSVGDTTYITVAEPGVAFWTGIGTYSAASQMTLTTVEETKGTFGAGTKEVMSGSLASSSILREDIAGAIVTGGTSTAYTATSYRKYGTLAAMDAAIIAFTPHVTCGATVTLAVDGLAAKPLRIAPGVELQVGMLIAGTPYFCLYNNTSGAFYLHAMGGNPYGIPLGGGLDYWGSAAPNGAFALAQGQAISRTTFATLFSLFGTTFGAGNGSTTFNIPDKVGRVSAMQDIGSARISSTYFGGNPANLGAVGGVESHTITLAQTPSGITSANGGQNISVRVSTSGVPSGMVLGSQPLGGGAQPAMFPGALTPGTSITSSDTNSISVTSTNTGGAAHNNVQPTIVCNYIIRVL